MISSSFDADLEQKSKNAELKAVHVARKKAEKQERYDQRQKKRTTIREKVLADMGEKASAPSKKSKPQKKKKVPTQTFEIVPAATATSVGSDAPAPGSSPRKHPRSADTPTKKATHPRGKRSRPAPEEDTPSTSSRPAPKSTPKRKNADDSR
eukprot:GAFH01004220.1.p2 GENE.GAFH01004220.1~~GAFH01004220.1.p2  ORF type:complete len:152 (+),score=0.85 GAFH01004220.1:147-602(+)